MRDVLVSFYIMDSNSNVADFASHMITVPDMYEHIELKQDNGKAEQFVVEDRRWHLNVVGSQVVTVACDLYLKRKD